MSKFSVVETLIIIIKWLLWDIQCRIWYDEVKKYILTVKRIQEMLIKERPLILSINSYLGCDERYIGHTEPLIFIMEHFLP